MPVSCVQWGNGFSQPYGCGPCLSLHPYLICPSFTYTIKSSWPFCFANSRLFHTLLDRQYPIMKSRLKCSFLREPSMSKPQKNGSDPGLYARTLLPSPLFVPRIALIVFEIISNDLFLNLPILWDCKLFKGRVMSVVHNSVPWAQGSARHIVSTGGTLVVHVIKAGAGLAGVADT